MLENDYPDKPCGCCKSTKFHRNLPSHIGEKRGYWICAICHPPIEGVPGEFYEIDIKGQEREALKLRIKNGIDKMWQAWEQIKKMAPEKEDAQYEAKNQLWKDTVDKWVEAERRLEQLIQQLNLQYEYDDCVFLVNGKKRNCLGNNPDGAWCILCTCDKTKGPKYWENEIGFKSPEVRPISVSQSSIDEIKSVLQDQWGMEVKRDWLYRRFYPK